MTHRFSRAAALAAVLMVPATLSAQATRPVAARAAAPGAVSEATARQWMAELEQIKARLQVAHNRVMQDPQLRNEQEALMREVRAAMQRVDPGLDALATRVDAMRAEASAALQRGDRARLQQLNEQLVPIQQRFMRAQQAVMQQPAIRQHAAALEQRLHQRMLAIEPETDRLLARGYELQGRLVRVAQQEAAGGPRRQ
ncbi:MAG TPA: hypothetical protein VF771_02520 [Longimicrobiaceae bacterium]